MPMKMRTKKEEIAETNDEERADSAAAAAATVREERAEDCETLHDSTQPLSDQRTVKRHRDVVFLYSKVYFNTLRFLSVHSDRERMTLALVHALHLQKGLQFVAPMPHKRKR